MSALDDRRQQRGVPTWSTKNGGRLCVCGHMKACHENSSGQCMECAFGIPPEDIHCGVFRDRAPETI